MADADGLKLIGIAFAIVTFAVVTATAAVVANVDAERLDVQSTSLRGNPRDFLCRRFEERPWNTKLSNLKSFRRRIHLAGNGSSFSMKPKRGPASRLHAPTPWRTPNSPSRKRWSLPVDGGFVESGLGGERGSRNPFTSSLPAASALHPTALESAFARVTPSSASATPSYSDTQQEGNQQGAERRFPRNVAQDAERHAGLSTFLDRISNAIGSAPDRFGNLFNRRLRRWAGIQAFIHKRWGRHVIGHGRTPRSTSGNRIARASFLFARRIAALSHRTRTRN